MRTCLAALGALLVAVPAQAGAALTAPAPVTALAAAGGRVAFASAWTKGSCERVFLRRPRAPLLRFPAGPCPEVSTGRGVASVAVAGDRVLWLAFAGGNTREWLLWTATATRPRPRLLRLVPRGPEAPAPVVLGGGGTLLPYALGRTVVVLRADGSRAFTWTAPAPVLALATRGAQVAVAEEGGRAAVVSAGRVVREERFGHEISAVAFAGGALVVQEPGALELRGAGSALAWSLPAGARLEDADATEAAYVARGRVHLLRLADGRDRVAATGQLAQLDAGRLLVADGRRILAAARH